MVVRNKVSDRAGYYLRALLHSVHPKLAMANAVGRVLPDFVSGAVRAQLYRWAGFKIGKGAFIMGNVELVSNHPGFYDKLTIGAGTVVSTHVTINLDALVSVGKNVCISPYVLIYTGSHRIGPGSKRMGEASAHPVIIEDGTWVRLGAIILPGVTVGHGSIVGAGAVVFENVPPNSHVEGNPAKLVRELRDGGQ